jgi:caprin-1
MLSIGKELQPDQKTALEKYGEVVGSLEMLKECMKHVNTVHADYLKQQKRQVRREQHERHRADITRLKTMLLFQVSTVMFEIQTSENRLVLSTRSMTRMSDDLFVDIAYALICIRGIAFEVV